MTNAFDTVYYPYYGHLNATNRRLYEQLLSGYQSCKEKILVTSPAQHQDAADVIDAIYYDHPEIFWMSQKATIYRNSATGRVTSVVPEYNDPVIRIPQLQRELNAAVKRYLAAAEGKKLLDQERILHDKMADEISYVKGKYDQTAYGALVEHRAVCAGYSRAFQLLMQKIGVPCYYCSGEAIGSHDTTWGSHAWNILKLGNEFYNMDLTWDDCYDKSNAGKISYTYYNCDDRQLASNHMRSEKCRFLPACNSTRYTFKGITGTAPKLEEIYQDGVTCRQVIRSVSDFNQYIAPLIRKSIGKPTEISFPVEGENNYQILYNRVFDLIEPITANTLSHEHCGGTDFHDGWHRIKITITYDDPLEKICSDGVTCRQIIRSATDFNRYIIPTIRKSAGRTTTVIFPVKVDCRIDNLKTETSDAIRNLFSDRSYSWKATWWDYHGGWYRMQYTIEYK